MSNALFERILLAFTTIVAACTTVVALYFYETRFMPVVDGWRVTSFQSENGVLYISGELVKKRPCRLVQTDVKLEHVDGTSMLVYQIRPDADVLGVDVTLGHTTWGPVKIPVTTRLLQEVRSGDRFVVKAMHQCHGLWLQTTEYGRFDANEILDIVRGGE